MPGSNLFAKDIKALVFDLDGTLLDSFSAHFEAYKLMFARFDIQITMDKFLSTYSPDWYQTYKAMGLPQEHWEKANLYWLEEAAKQFPELYPEVLNTLNKLRDNFTLGLVTSGSKVRVIRDLERTGIQNFFSYIITGDDIQNPKPSPEGLELVLRQINVKPNEAIYIGDSYADFQMAEAAGIRFVGIKSEFVNLETSHPDYKVYSIKDLPDLIGV